MTKTIIFFFIFFILYACHSSNESNHMEYKKFKDCEIVKNISKNISNNINYRGKNFDIFYYKYDTAILYLTHQCEITFLVKHISDTIATLTYLNQDCVFDTPKFNQERVFASIKKYNTDSLLVSYTDTKTITNYNSIHYKYGYGFPKQMYSEDFYKKTLNTKTN